MKRIRKFAARVTQPKSEREKARLAKLEKENEVHPESVSSEDVPNPASDPKGRQRRRRRRSRCDSRHSLVLGCDGYPSPPPFCSALNDDKGKAKDGCDSSGSQTSFSESEWSNVTMPYPFAIGTITGDVTPNDELEIPGVVTVDPFHPAEPVAGPSGMNTGSKCMTLSNRDSDTLSMESLLDGRTTSEEQILGTMWLDPSFKAKYSRYERLINQYWQVRDFQGNSRLENWLNEQIEEVEVQARQRRAREDEWWKRFGEASFG